MSRVKNQHQVAQAYLRRFSIPGKEGRVWVYDKKLQKSFVSSIENVASGKSYYDVPEIDRAVGEPQAVERIFLGAYDGLGASVLRELCESLGNGSFSGLSDRHRQELAAVIAVQHLRTDAMRQTLLQLTTAVRKQELRYAELLKIHKGIDAKVGFDPTRDVALDMPGEHAHLMLNPENRAQIEAALLLRCWIIWKNTTTQPYFTSDNPVVLTPAGQLGLMQAGILRIDAEVSFPLTPEYLLVVVDGRVTPNARLLDSRVCEVSKLPPEAARGHVIYANGVQIVNAKRQLYSSTNDFALAEKALAEWPGLGDPDRPRMRLG